MSRIFRLPDAATRDPAIATWFRAHAGELGAIAKHWFDIMRACGDDVRETMHDGQPTACVGDAAFAYVAVYTAHVNVGFYLGAELPDPGGLLVGSGRWMRHVSLSPDCAVDSTELAKLVESAYLDMKGKLPVP